MKNIKDITHEEENQSPPLERIFKVVNEQGVALDIKIDKSHLDFKGGKKALDTHNKNPYHENLMVSIQYGTKSKAMIGNQEQLYDGAGNAIPMKLAVMQQEIVDKQKFVKVYVDQIELMFELPKYAGKLFYYIVQNIVQGTDEIYLFPKDIIEACGWKNTIQLDKALIVLCRRGFLAKSYRTYWWYINPTIFFNGDRVTFIRQIVKQSTQTQLDFDNGQK